MKNKERHRNLTLVTTRTVFGQRAGSGFQEPLNYAPDNAYIIEGKFGEKKTH